MKYSLNSTIIKSGSTIENVIILCHGYGGDGKDISIVARYWKNFLPNTLFVCPDAPEVCKVNSTGFQWFDLMDQTEDEILSKSLVAEAKLNKFIDEVKETNKIKTIGFILLSLLLNTNKSEIKFRVIYRNWLQSSNELITI